MWSRGGREQSLLFDAERRLSREKSSPVLQALFVDEQRGPGSTILVDAAPQVGEFDPFGEEFAAALGTTQPEYDRWNGRAILSRASQQEIRDEDEKLPAEGSRDAR